VAVRLRLCKPRLAPAQAGKRLQSKINMDRNAPFLDKIVTMIVSLVSPDQIVKTPRKRLQTVENVDKRLQIVENVAINWRKRACSAANFFIFFQIFSIFY